MCINVPVLCVLQEKATSERLQVLRVCACDQGGTGSGLMRLQLGADSGHSAGQSDYPWGRRRAYITQTIIIIQRTVIK